MNKKDYEKPSMKVITMKHRVGFLCGSGGNRSVNRASISESNMIFKSDGIEDDVDDI